jgi:hypothetical protein
MSKFLLNVLVQISKAFIYSKIQILFGNNSSQILAHPAFQPSHDPFFFFCQPAAPPLPPGPQPLGRPSRPARRWHLTRLSSSSRGSTSSRARLTGGPHLSSLTSGPPELGRVATTSRRLAPPRMPSEPLPPRHHFPSLISLLTSPSPSMALTPLTPPLLPPPATPLQHCPPATPLRCSTTSKTKLSRSLNYSSWINKASHLGHVAPIVIFSIYSLELELHDRKV